MPIFFVAALLIKAKQQHHGKNQNKNTGLFISFSKHLL
jgi:hypothetical protein